MFFWVIFSYIWASNIIMWSKLYYIDLMTILTMMAIGAVIGFMVGRRYMDYKLLIVFTIVFLVASFLFLDTTQPEFEEKQVRKAIDRQVELPKPLNEETPALTDSGDQIIEPTTE